MSVLNTKLLRQITDFKKVDRINESLSWAVRSQLKPRRPVEITLFKLAQWVAVPAKSESLTRWILREQLQRTLLAHGSCELWAVLLEQELCGHVYTVPLTLEGIEEFRRTMGAFCCALFAGEPEPDWVIISLESELDVIAGPSDFVRQFLYCEIEEGFSHFQSFIMHEAMPKQVRKYLHHVYDCLKDNYQNAEVGAEFRL